MDFNENQKRVIAHEKGPLLVEAGPGSGKTTVIVERIKYLLNNLNIAPESILVITFTRKAAENLRNRLNDYISKDDLSKMHISTIHSFCLEYLKSKEGFLKLLDDDNSEKKELFIQKHKGALGFVGPATLFDYQIPAIIDKFGEYTSFNVNTDKLINYIKETKPISKDYLDFIESEIYFSKKRIEDNDFKDDWYNARYLQTPKAYLRYLEVLDNNSYVDYDTLQLKTLKHLIRDPKTQFHAVLIDEFQDTDPLQIRIYEILLMQSDYFTAVGDVDQHIYAFRSSFRDYFKDMKERFDAEIISLDVNYRSTANIVRVTDSFIKHQRSDYTQKHLVSNNDDYDNDTFLIESEDSQDEASKIFKIITELKRLNKIEDYGEVAVLYRKHNTRTIANLIELLDENNIEFVIRGQNDLADQNEIRSILLLLWYLTRSLDKGHVLSGNELDELNLKAFCGEYFEPTFWSLEDETKTYLTTLQDLFYDDILKVENEIRSLQGKRPVKSYKRVRVNESYENLIRIFNKVTPPVIDLRQIHEADREFFNNLNNLRKRILNNELTILDVYYELISLNFNKLSQDKVRNLSMLTRTIYNYESFISQTDVKGLFYFLNRIIKNYGSNYSSQNGVQLMTVHAAKGLEFPVAIVASLEKDKFPMKIKDLKREKRTIFMKDTFYTPNEFLKYKEVTLDEENELDRQEEERIIYVAMTRAADLLILSCVGKTPDVINNIKNYLKKPNLNNVIINRHFTNNDTEKLKLNYSSFSTYNLCPYMYDLVYNYGFKVSSEKVTNFGTVFHEVMETVNLKLKDGEKISKEELILITQDIYKSMFDIKETEDEFNMLIDSILNYYNTYSLNQEVVECELPFELEHENYILNGEIDLIYKIKDSEIAILDYKNAEHDDNKIAHYEKQLYIYASALKEMTEFDKYEIKKGITHFVKTDYRHEVDITDEKINKQLYKLNEVALKIQNNEYPKRESGFCNVCKFQVICQN
ncbi:UvrD-helicase domain-containing protein [Methanobrevibacter gottschalkii]|uniref:UvrD-helicase domain-containing protein n=1 Tax=Methanobrevibacter gottschalkii TaxID=190974 RepID=UPI0038CF8BD4